MHLDLGAVGIGSSIKAVGAISPGGVSMTLIPVNTKRFQADDELLRFLTSL